MKSVNEVQKHCWEWYHLQSSNEKIGPLQEINLKLLDLQVKKCDWTTVLPETKHKGPTRRVNVNNKTENKNVYISGHLQTSTESKMQTNIILEEGRLEGLYKKMRLPLPDEVRLSLGETVKIDASKPTSQPENVMTISVTSGHDIPEKVGGATAVVSCKTGEYYGTFSAVVELTGLVTFKEADGEVLQADISKIVRDIVKNNKSSLTGKELEEAVKALTSWPMKGYAEFTWDFEQTIDWEKPKTEGK